MGYYKIPNLYKAQNILQFKQVYAMEKIHGTSTHIKYQKKDDISVLSFFAGGCNHKNFVQLFDQEALRQKLDTFGDSYVVIYGEGYGGKMQRMSKIYGNDLKFVAFDVMIGETWLSVPQAEEFVVNLGLEFVDYKLVNTDLEILDYERNKPSVQAIRNGCGDNQKREGIVLRPPFEVQLNNKKRLIVKYKADDFNETRKTRKIVDPGSLETLKEAQAITDEWCTEMRLNHILGNLPEDVGMEKISDIIKLMIEDITVEAGDEVEMSRAAKKCIGTQTVKMFKNRLQSRLGQAS